MRLSEQWLREWVNPPVATPALAEQLTMAGLEVDAVEPAAPAFSGVVVGEVLEVKPHPNADKLRVCQVDVGGEAPLGIVCGAPNVRPGMRAPTAVLGAELPGGFRIKKAKLRGEPSTGMLCSAAELGLNEDASGLWDLPADAPVGEDLRAWLGLDDHCIEVDLTPNRGDCLSVAGVAREVGVLNRVPVTSPALEPVAATCPDTFPVALEAGSQCPRYTGRVIRGIRTGVSSPLWLQERLRRSGLRSISPVVDVTNYVLLELGQPMHAFDLDRLRGGIVVRMARPGEPITLLDGQALELDPETLVIADGDHAQAIAGVMGGEGSGVEAETVNVFLESAYFEPVATAGRARRYGLHTDSSHRFERGVDPQLQARALERATRLLLDIVGGEPGPLIEVKDDAHLSAGREVSLRRERITRVLGTTIADAEVSDTLERLGMRVSAATAGWTVKVPTYRFDVEREVDLIEEIGRIHGYARLPVRRPTGELLMPELPETRIELERMQGELTARGYQEAVTYSFVDPKLQAVLDPGREPLALANPISADLAVMRTSLWPGLVQALRYNQNRQEPMVRLFETGLRFVPVDGELKQERMIGAVAAGLSAPEQWSLPRRKVDFFDLKADVEALLALTGEPEAFRFVRSAHPALHPGQAAEILRGDEVAGQVGLLHPAVERDLDLDGPVYLFELRLAVLERARLPAFRELSRFPAVRRDLALVLDEAVSAEQLVACIRAVAGESQEEVRIFDVYRGEGIDPGRKSLAISLTFRDPSRTLNEAEINEALKRVVNALQTELNASLRE